MIATGAQRVRATVKERWFVVGLFVAFLLVRIPTLTRFSVNWDAVNFALGVRQFDLVHHQPHPPGYIGFVAIGRLVTTVTGDPHTALTLISLVAGAVLPAVFYLLARRMMSQRGALLAAVLLGSSPVVWYYSVVALTYIAAAAATIALVWACYVARHERSTGHLLGAALLLSLLGAIRQTDLVLLLPVFVWALRPFGSRDRWRSMLLFAGATATWAVPLVWMAGGPVAYVRLAMDLAQLAGGPTWIGSFNPVGLLQNMSYVFGGVIVGMNVALIALPLAARFRVRPWRSLAEDDRAMLIRWLLPAIAVYLFLHTGQLGYVLLLLPAGFLIAGIALSGAWSEVERRWRERRTSAGGRWGVRVVTGLVVLVGVNAAGFFVLPNAALALLGPGADGSAFQVAESFVDSRSDVHARTRQYHLRANDAYWRELTRFIDRLDSDSTALLSLPANNGSFRHLAYYLPEFRAYGLGHDRQQRFGHLFTARDREINYRIESLEHARGALNLPEEVETLIVPDGGIQERLDPSLQRHIIRLRSGPPVVLVHVEPGSRLVFEPTARDRTRITVGSSTATVSGLDPGA